MIKFIKVSLLLILFLYTTACVSSKTCKRNEEVLNDPKVKNNPQSTHNEYCFDESYCNYYSKECRNMRGAR